MIISKVKQTFMKRFIPLSCCPKKSALRSTLFSINIKFISFVNSTIINIKNTVTSVKKVLYIKQKLASMNNFAGVAKNCNKSFCVGVECSF